MELIPRTYIASCDDGDLRYIMDAINKLAGLISAEKETKPAGKKIEPLVCTRMAPDTAVANLSVQGITDLIAKINEIISHLNND